MTKRLLLLSALAGCALGASAATNAPAERILRETARRVIRTSAEDMNFCRAHGFADGTVCLSHSFGTHLGTERHVSVCSRDFGKTWDLSGGALGGGNAFTGRDGSKRGVGCWSKAYAREHPCRLAVVGEKGRILSFAGKLTLPFAASVCGHREVIRLKDGRLLWTVYGKCSDTEPLFASVVVSYDDGLNWTHLSTLPREPGCQEGPNEASVTQRKDGALLAVVRTGNARWKKPGLVALLQYTSHDLGRSWSDRRVIADYGVAPQIQTLSDGTIAVVSGRPGVYILLDETGTGEHYRRYEIYSGMGSSYSTLIETKPGRLLLIYDESNFHHFRNQVATNRLWAVDYDYRAAADDRVPVVDLTGDASRQVVIAAGTKDRYEGHPTTLLADDGKTMFCVWTTGHGGPCGQMARSDDAGRTWTRLDATLPPSYARTHRNCPTLQKAKLADGRTRYLVFSAKVAEGSGLGILASDDAGKTWYESPCQEHLSAGMPPTGFMPLRDGTLALFGQVRKNPAVKRDRPTDDQNVWMSVSSDGGLTWGPARTVAAAENRNLCEPCCLRSPDGRSLVLLMRENRHAGRSMMCFSRDEGKTWSTPVDTAWALTGDRHEGVLLPDGRYVIAFRDQAIGSPTRGQFVAWVGTWEDLEKGRPGQYRIHLIRHHFRKRWPGANGDTGYSGVELLPDGTIVATTYARCFPDGSNEDGRQSSVVSTRFRIAETDRPSAAPARIGNDRTR